MPPPGNPPRVRPRELGFGLRYGPRPATNGSYRAVLRPVAPTSTLEAIREVEYSLVRSFPRTVRSGRRSSVP